jgi:hypothetical protein
LTQMETARRAQVVAQLARVEIGEDGGQELRRLVGVDDVARFGEDGIREDVGREDLAVAVDQIGSRHRDIGGRGAPHVLLVVDRNAELDQATPR